MALDELDLDSRFDRDSGVVVLGGIAALVRLPMQIHRHEARAGRRTATFVSGYEGSPLGGYDTALARESKRLAAHEVHHRPAVNEELAATAVWGSQQVDDAEGLDGIVGLWYGKSPGLDRAGDAIRHANTMGVPPFGGAVLLVGDDPACKSSTIPSASESTLADLNVPVLAPGNAQELLTMGLHAVALSRYTGGWTGLKIVTDVADGFGSVDLDAVSAVAPQLPSLNIDDRPWQPRMARTTPPDSVTAERQVLRGRRIAAQRYAAANTLDRVHGATVDASIGFVAAGKTYLDLTEALAELGLATEQDLTRAGVRMLKVGMPYPLESGIVRRFAAGLSEVVVVEEKRPFMEAAIRQILYDTDLRPTVVGEQDERGRELIPVDGELTVGRILAPLRARLGSTRLPAPARATLSQAALSSSAASTVSVVTPGAPASTRTLPLVSDLATTRGPWFCSGCPHNRSTVVPDGSSVGAGIGCHAMVQMSGDERRTADTITQMGGEGAQWIGMAPFARERHAFQNLGDGTFFHSGSLAVRAAVAAGVSITFKLLHNGAVAMTGGQDAVGGRPLHDIVAALLAEGVVAVAVVADDPARVRAAGQLPGTATLHGRDELDGVQRRLQSTAGVTVLIYDQECAAEARRDRKRGIAPTPTTRVMINERVCEGCGDCGVKSNCLSVQPVETPFGRRTQIHQSSCNYDYSCIDGDCPSFVTVGVGDTPSRAAQAAAHPIRPRQRPPVVADPPPSPAGSHGTLLAGIGGTGVVTVNQVLAMAAQLDGRRVTGLDQTGLSQKAGPVVSHLRVLDGKRPSSSPRVTASSTDALIVLDPIVGTQASVLEMASPDRTVAVVSTRVTPTGAMVTDARTTTPPLGHLRQQIDGRTRAEANVYLDAAEIAERLLGSHLFANMVVIGAALQAGVLPVSLTALRRAIELNGTAVDDNLEAIAWGRAAAAAPTAVQAALDGARVPTTGPAPIGDQSDHRPSAATQACLSAADLPSDLAELVSHRATDLVGYQDQRLAHRYVGKVLQVWRAERPVDGTGTVTRLAAQHLHKVLAYKDEYEVARLYRDPAWLASVREEFPDASNVRILLHPPALRALGMRRKIGVGLWAQPGFDALYRMRRLRGSLIDPFGHTHVRAAERRLIATYLDDLNLIISTLSAANAAEAAELAALPDLIRGYEEVKLRGIAEFEARRTGLRRLLHGAGHHPTHEVRDGRPMPDAF